MAPSKNKLKIIRKFEKKHLPGLLKRRNASAKIKQRQKFEKTKVRRAQDGEFHKGGKARPNGPRLAKNSEAMSVDDFFQGDWEFLAPKSPSQMKALAGKPDKQKRDQPTAEDRDASDDNMLQVGVEPVASDSEDDEADADQGAGPGAGMSKLAIDTLAKNDPDFDQFLKKGNLDVQSLDEIMSLAGVDDLSNSEDGEQTKKRQKTRTGDEAQELTIKMTRDWIKDMKESHSIKAARQTVLAFRSAARVDMEEDSVQLPYIINNPEVFHEVVISALKHIPDVLQHHVPVKESASGRVYLPTDSKKFKSLAPLVKNFTASIICMLGTLSDDGTLKLTLASVNPLLPYLLGLRPLLKALIKTVIAFWSQPASNNSTRITAYLVIRRLMVIGDGGVRDALFKAVYQGLVQGSPATNSNTIQGINLMKNSAAELWGIDQRLGYMTAFTSIRQLALHLRTSIAHNQNDSYKKVYNWQYLHSLDFWSSVLAEHCSSINEAAAGKESPLRPLIYPLVQVSLGTMRLIPTSAYFPLRFQLVRSLFRISRATGIYIPLASVLIEVLNSAELKRPARQSTLKYFNFAVAYRAPKSYLRTVVYQDGLSEQVVELLGEYFALWSTNITFPELSLPVVIMLKRWLKEVSGKSGGGGNKYRAGKGGNRNGKMVQAVVILVQKLEANATFITDRRDKVDFAPKDRTQVNAFLRDFEWEKTPVGAYVVAQRKLRVEKQMILEEARQEEEKMRKDEEQWRHGKLEKDEDSVEMNGDEDRKEVDEDQFDDKDEDMDK